MDNLKSILLFLSVSVLILVTWYFIQPKPPKPQVPPDSAEVKKDTKPPVTEKKETPPKEANPPKPEPKPPQKEEKKPEEPAVPKELVELGDLDPDSPFQQYVVLTSRGAGVLKAVLNKFQAADRLGRPYNPPRPLEWIPEEANAETASNVLYHYALKDEDHPDHPLDTLGRRNWQVVSKKVGKDLDVQEVAFQTEVEGVVITKTFNLGKGDYHLGLAVKLERKAGRTDAVKIRYQLDGSHGHPLEGDWYTPTYRNAYVGLTNGSSVWRDLQDSRTVGFQAGGREVPATDDRWIRYAAVATQYFASAIVVDDKQESQRILEWVRPTVEGEVHPGKPFLDDMTVRAVSRPVEVKPGTPVVHKYLLYNGPVKVRLLSHLDGQARVPAGLVDRYENQLALNTLTDYERLGWWSWLLISFTNVMHTFLWLLHKIMPWSLGLCVIVLTLLVRATMYPLIGRRQAIATAKFQAQVAELAPEEKKLKEKFGDDAWGFMQAKNELYRKRGIDQFAPMRTCWMVFAQMPIFLGLYYSLQESIFFRLAPFLWIKNLAAPDMLIWWSEKVPMISRPEDLGSALYLGPYFNLLPVLAFALMMVQQIYLTPMPSDPQVAQQMKIMRWTMVIFLLMFYKVAAGLCIYFIVSSLWGLCERKLLPKPQPRGGAGDDKVTAGRKPGPGPAGKPRSRPASPNGNGKFQSLKEWWRKILEEARKK